ncbi:MULTISPECIES: 7-carboxy-7-deazaguanine synthase QueE [unclassified Aureispira]|uniref:7-carboxy-7-deazaguanine synthase QueE n=1 Tax=unclassified Aureispira TaxID=2649989 RepID=UPI0006986698|nr:MULTISPECIES: 7-carboxy-7-deazaguanine synthase QueE [unclassified Aureispira]WMX16855.1 7-carboxy-7-deazaguanine synthase QueE [Aureispira sp. CCB-E]
MSKNQKIAVSEYFYSLQGEGRTSGIPAIFLRLTGCNLMCGGKGVEKDGVLRDGATWVCDTIDVWMKGTTYSFADLLKELNQSTNFIQRLQTGVHLVITGGEPLLQQERIVAFLEYLETEYALRPIIEIETNATILPLSSLDARVHYWNTSPKLSNSGMPTSQRINHSILKWFSANPNTMFKFVVTTKQDFEEIQTQLVHTGLIDSKKIVLMPGADSIEQLLERNQLVADICIEHQLRMCTRLHIEIWNQLTGV